MAWELFAHAMQIYIECDSNLIGHTHKAIKPELDSIRLESSCMTTFGLDSIKHLLLFDVLNMTKKCVSQFISTTITGAG